MQRMFCLLLAILLLALPSESQRRLEIAAASTSAEKTSAVLNGKIIIAGNRETFLKVYNDATISTFNFPVVEGVRLKFAPGNKICVFGPSVYITLWKDSLGMLKRGFLYRFNGTSFTRIMVPGQVVSSCAVLGDSLYVLSVDAGRAKLFRYNGIAVTEVTSTAVPLSYSYNLITANKYLYLIGKTYYADEPEIVRQFDGRTVTTLPDIYLTDYFKIVPIGETNRAYFLIEQHVFYYNGSSIYDIYDNPYHDMQGGRVDGVMWRDEFYFTSTTGTFCFFGKASGSVVTMFDPPAGSRNFVAWSDLGLYRDTLFVHVYYNDDSAGIQKFDGANFYRWLDFRWYYFDPAEMFQREGRLIIIPGTRNRNNAFEYNASSLLTEIIAPEGHILKAYVNRTTCNFLWESYIERSYPYTNEYFFVKEAKTCPPRLIIPIPEHFRDYPLAEIGFSSGSRRITWSTTGFHWIPPECGEPPCPSPEYRISFTSKSGKIAWQQDFTKPFHVLVPLKDDQAYQASLSSQAANSVQPLVVMDETLVSKGITSVNLSLKPLQNYFKLSATTVKSLPVPLTATLYNKMGKSIWEKTFTAPFSKLITDELKEAGEILYFSIPETQSKTAEPIIIDFSFFPNPARGQLNIEILTTGKHSDALLTICSFSGEIYLKESVQVPCRKLLDLTALKTGWYVLKLNAGEKEISRLVRVE